MKLTAEEKLEALAYRFYQGGKWEPKAGDLYTTSRADLEVYQVTEVDELHVCTKYTEGSDTVTQWDRETFQTEGFGPKRVYIPPHVAEKVIDRYKCPAPARAVWIHPTLKKDLADRWDIAPDEVESRLRDGKHDIRYVMREFLEWHGILGWSELILDVENNLREMGLK